VFIEVASSPSYTRGIYATLISSEISPKLAEPQIALTLSMPLPYTCRVPCVKRGGVRFRINGHDYFNHVLVSNVDAIGLIKSMDVKSSDLDD
jgi:hypothetical protein